jgi:hypothetical protein
MTVTWLGGTAYHEGRRVGSVMPDGKLWRAFLQGEAHSSLHANRGAAEAALLGRARARLEVAA